MRLTERPTTTKLIFHLLLMSKTYLVCICKPTRNQLSPSIGRIRWQVNAWRRSPPLTRAIMIWTGRRSRGSNRLAFQTYRWKVKRSNNWVPFSQTILWKMKIDWTLKQLNSLLPGWCSNKGPTSDRARRMQSLSRVECIPQWSEGHISTRFSQTVISIVVRLRLLHLPTALWALQCLRKKMVSSGWFFQTNYCLSNLYRNMWGKRSSQLLLRVTAKRIEELIQ